METNGCFVLNFFVAPFSLCAVTSCDLVEPFHLGAASPLHGFIPLREQEKREGKICFFFLLVSVLISAGACVCCSHREGRGCQLRPAARVLETMQWK